MSNQKLSTKAKISIGLGLIVFALLSRLMPHPPNFAPITAIALFGATILPKRASLIVPLLAIILSDLVIGLHDTIIWTWGSFALIALMGSKYLRGQRSALKLGAVTISSSILFFVVTNFGVWMNGYLYPRTLDGLVNAYTLGIPFFRNTLLGDMFYTFGIFALYALAIKLGNQVSALESQKKIR
jgi:hypothetical protein